MRLRRLDLTRFGHFTDVSLDFGPRQADRADLHIVFGPNEAGKTTAFEGYLDLLFGIPPRSRYNFLHDYETMQVGAALDLDGDAIELVRIKRTKADLLTREGTPANPAQLMQALGGLERDQYRAMFSLDDKTIEEGGEDILASQGNLGELLFSAAAGLSDLGAVLDSVRAEIDDFHKPRARKTALAEGKRELQDLQRQIREVDVAASEFRRLVDGRDRAKMQCEEAKSERDRLASERSRLDAILDCLPQMAALRSLKDAHKALSGYPEVSDAWHEEARSLRTQAVEAETTCRDAQLRRDARAKELEDLEIDEAIFEISEQLTIQLDIPRSRARTAEEDLPRRHAELESLSAELVRLARSIGLETPEEGSLPEFRISKLAELAEEYADESKSLAQAQQELARAQERRAKFDSAAEPDTGENEQGQRLTALLERLNPERLLADARAIRESLQRAENELADAVSELRPWTGSPNELEDVILLEEVANRCAAKWAGLQEDWRERQKVLQDAELKARQLDARLSELRKDGAATVHAELEVAKSGRNDLWQCHLESLNGSSADAFHAAMMRVDVLQEAQLGVAERLAQIREMELERAATEAALLHGREAAEALDEEIEKGKSATGELLSGLGLPREFDPRDLPAWRKSLSEAVACWRECRRQREALEEIDERIRVAEAKLSAAIEAQPGTSPSELVAVARRRLAELVERDAALKEKRSTLETAKSDERSRAQEAERLRSELEKLSAAWSEECSSLPESLKNIEQVRLKLPILRSIAAKLHDRDKLQTRIEAMEADRKGFGVAITSLAQQVEEEAEGQEPLVIAERLKRRLETAQDTRAKVKTIDGHHAEEVENIQRAEATLVSIRKRASEMSASLSQVRDIATVDELVAALEDAKRAAVQRTQIAEDARRICNRLGVQAIDEAEKLLSGADALELRAVRETTEADFSAAEELYMERVGDLRAASDALAHVGGDDVPAQLEARRQTLLLGLADKALSTLQLKLGLLAAERALAAYRDAHRSTMLAETEAAFRRLTGARYESLRTQTDGQRELLLALRRADGRSITVGEMSKGTRFQLYLALRLAGYRQYAEGGRTLPFIADDIFETFDNTRTNAALGLLKEIALQGQAIYFTHHEHVVDLAREVCGDNLTLHELPALTSRDL